MSRKKRNKWVNTWVNQTELGNHFNMSAIAIGKALVAIGIKDGAGPTKAALGDGQAITQVEMRSGVTMTRWNKNKVIPMLKDFGCESVDAQQVKQNRNEQQAKKVAAEIWRLWSSDDGMDQKLATIQMDLLRSEYSPEVVALIEKRLDELGEKERASQSQ